MTEICETEPLQAFAKFFESLRRDPREREREKPSRIQKGNLPIEALRDAL